MGQLGHGHGQGKILHRAKKSVQEEDESVQVEYDWDKGIRKEHKILFKQIWANLSDEAKNKTVDKFMAIHKKAFESRMKFEEKKRKEIWKELHDDRETDSNFQDIMKQGGKEDERPIENSHNRVKRFLPMAYGRIKSLLKKKKHLQMKQSRLKSLYKLKHYLYMIQNALHGVKKSLVEGPAQRMKSLRRVRRDIMTNELKESARKKLFNVSDVSHTLPPTTKRPRDRRKEWTPERRKAHGALLRQRYANRSEEAKNKTLERLKKAKEARRKYQEEEDEIVRRMESSNETTAEFIDWLNRTGQKEGNQQTRPPEKQPTPEKNERVEFTVHWLTTEKGEYEEENSKDFEFEEE
ncbi:hypothetical protein WDU94_000282 [Cyamophila willieti]